MTEQGPKKTPLKTEVDFVEHLINSILSCYKTITTKALAYFEVYLNLATD